MEDWSESSEILLKDVLPSYCKKRVDGEEKKTTKKQIAVKTMMPKDQHPKVMEFSRSNLGEVGHSHSGSLRSRCMWRSLGMPLQVAYCTPTCKSTLANMGP